jgi:hypothetical protein
MDWNLSWIGWTLVGIDLVFNIIALCYAFYLTRTQGLGHNKIDDDATLTSRAGDVDEDEIICMKLGRQEAVRVIVAKLIQKGFVNIREISRDSSESAQHSPMSGTIFEYRAVEYRDPSELPGLERDVLSSLKNFKNIAAATEDLAPLPLFESYKKKMRDFGLVFEKSYIEKGIETAYRLSYIALPLMLLSLLMAGHLDETKKILLYASALNSLFSLPFHLVLYRGAMSFNHIYPAMLPAPNLKEFIRCYERKFKPVLGAKAYEEVLEWRRKRWNFRFW